MACTLGIKTIFCSGAEDRTDPTRRRKDKDSIWIPGDGGFFDNTAVGDRENAIDTGENVLYLGGDEFWGHVPEHWQPPVKSKCEWEAMFPPRHFREYNERDFPADGLDR
jgi:hypothetical protein